MHGLGIENLKRTFPQGLRGVAAHGRRRVRLVGFGVLTTISPHGLRHHVVCNSAYFESDSSADGCRRSTVSHDGSDRGAGRVPEGNVFVK